MKRYSPNAFGDMYPDINGKWVEYDTHLKRVVPQDSQEGFRAFLMRRGIAKYHSLYGAVLHEIDELEDEAALYKGQLYEGAKFESIRNGDLLREIDGLKAELAVRRHECNTQGKIIRELREKLDR